MGHGAQQDACSLLGASRKGCQGVKEHPEDVGVKRLSDGTRLSLLDWCTNAKMDSLAKSAAQADRLPRAQRLEVQSLWDRVTAVAT